MKTENPLVSIIIVTYNNKDDIEECLDSILNQTYKNFEIIVVDNASKDGTPDIVQRKYPTVRLIRSPKNLGYAGGNALGLKFARGDYIVILNPDTVVDKNWLRELVSVANMDDKVGIVGACVLLYDRPDRINALGNILHFTGLVFCNAFYEPYDKYKEKDHFLALPSGAAFLVKRKVIEEVGFMDEPFFMEFSDTDFAVRAILKDWRCIVTRNSIVHHKWKPKMTPERLFVLERNRLLLLMRTFNRRLLAILLPSLLLTELLILGFCLISGKQYLSAKIASLKAILRLKKIYYDRDSRNVSYRNLMNYLDYKVCIPEGLIKLRSRKALQRLLSSVYRLLFTFSLKWFTN